MDPGILEGDWTRERYNAGLMHAFAQIRAIDEEVQRPPTIDLTQTAITVNGHLVDLTAMNHWRQTEDHSGGDHSPDQDYRDIRHWLDLALDTEEVLHDADLLRSLFSLLEGFSITCPSRYTVPRYVRYHIHLWNRFVAGVGDWPPGSYPTRLYNEYKERVQ